ncbi:NAD(P)-dependent alcohol dehydrogenase [Rugosimonospora africana]|uniref:NADPH:quinone reductase n=1 Tax=Rugosimonospora africana TaxID=556532 RepID=A0A8J3QQT9_9ACTN|nr:NAD(P)-dependent alcohol dehydrogenase [Rugosimonospora africana]GIH15224.1 NADPH:quinone reductase [Rugosimonospora africana]
MKAIVQDRYGSPDVLALREVSRPEPGEGQVLVRVRAATLNARDWHLMRGDPYLARLGMGLRRPKLRGRGSDFAGEVDTVGPGVTGLHPGEEVFGEADGALADYVCAPAALVVRKPANLSFAQAASLPLAGATALEALRDVGRIRPEQRLLVNGASGGVGTFAVQLGVHLGAEVTAVCSTRNVDLLHSLGAHHVIDYTRHDFTAFHADAAGPGQGQRYDLIFDLVGNRSLTDLRRVLAPTGTLLLSGGGVSRGGSLIGPLGLILKARLAAPLTRRQRLVVFAAHPTGEHLTVLAQLAANGTITPVIDGQYPLAQAAEAMRYLEVEHARGKVVIG